MKKHRLPIVYDLPKDVSFDFPFHSRRDKFGDPYEELADICLENLTFAAHTLLRWKGKALRLAPFQSIILETLWNKTFPILLMTRGGGKCITGDSIIQTVSGFTSIDSICSKKEGATLATIPMFGENGFNNTSFTWTNPPERLYEIETQFGYTIKGVGKHKVRIIENGEITWKKLKDFDGTEYVCISRDSEYQFEGLFNNLSGDAGYLFGALIGDGCFAASKPTSIGFTSKDADIIDEVQKACGEFQEIEFKSRKDPIEFSLNFGSRENKLLFLDKYCFKECKSKDKSIPTSILQSNKHILAQFISGYFDTDGTVNSKGVSITSVSEKLIRQLQTVLLSYGIISGLRIRSIGEGNSTAWTLDVRGEAAKIFQEKIGFRCERKREYLTYILKNKRFNSNRDLLRNSKTLLLQLNKELKANGYLIGKENRRLLAKSSIEAYDYNYSKVRRILDIYSAASSLNSYQQLKALYDKWFFFDSVIEVAECEPEITFDVHIPGDHTFISNGFVSHNTFMLAVYAVLRAILTPGSKIVIVAASFRQSKLVFEYIEQLYEFSPILRACCKSSPEKPSDSRKLRVGTSSILALPLGNGEKIRGIRACVSADTLIDTDEGLIEVREIVEADRDFNIYNTEGFETPKAYCRTNVTDVHRVSTMYGVQIEFSDIHRIYTDDGWKDIDSLTTNDRIQLHSSKIFPSNFVTVPERKVLNEKKTDYDIPAVDLNVGKILGYLVSEGCVSNRNGTISFVNTDEQIIRDYCDTFDNAFGVRPRVYERKAIVDKRGWNCKKSYEAKICRKGIRKYLEDIGLDYLTAPDKYIPWSILKSPRCVVVKFLKALFEGDGTAVLYKDSRRDSDEFYVGYYSASEKLCRQLQTLMLKFGLIGSCSQRAKGNLQYYLRFNRGQAAAFARDIGFISSRKILVCQEALDIFTPKYYDGRSLKIKKIEKKIRRDILYDVCMPQTHKFVGNGILNHNTHILTDEFASIPPEIFQVVVRGFAAVAADPIEAAHRTHKEEEAISQGRIDASDRTRTQGNQIVYSGTANFQFNHLYKLYCIHKGIIQSQYVGNADGLNKSLELEEDESFDGDLDYRDYAIIQIPYQGLPRSFMDEKQIAQARATMPKALFQMEYECIFPTDSDGFFKRSLINRATPGLPGYNKKSPFSIEIRGQAGYQYVMGVDPARKTDNFSIVILKLMTDGTYKNVFCDSMNRKSFPDATRRVRELLKRFNIVRIAMDSGGGGLTVMDLLQDEAMLESGDVPIWEYDNDETLKFEGRHILDMVNFNPTWLQQSNYGLAADIEHQRLIFPYRTRTGLSSEDHEKCWEEIDLQINEMCMIVVSATKTGVQHFDVPELPSTQQSTLKHNQRKDRYSALLLAGYAARTYITEGTRFQFPETGGWADDGSW